MCVDVVGVIMPLCLVPLNEVGGRHSRDRMLSFVPDKFATHLTQQREVSEKARLLSRKRVPYHCRTLQEA